jgi:16S rRNA processing protein RimM
MMVDSADLVVVGKITSVFGIKGWVKIHSYTEPMENLFAYKECFLQKAGQWQPLEFDDVKYHGKGLIGAIKDVDDREVARLYCQCDIAVPKSEMQELPEDDFYWHQLVGLEVYTDQPDDDSVLLGTVAEMMETGANDVLVVRPSKDSIDQRERLIPWLPEQVVKNVDIDQKSISVDWDPEF